MRNVSPYNHPHADCRRSPKTVGALERAPVKTVSGPPLRAYAIFRVLPWLSLPTDFEHGGHRYQVIRQVIPRDLCLDGYVLQAAELLSAAAPWIDNVILEGKRSGRKTRVKRS